jgi:hypothetical protein
MLIPSRLALKGLHTPGDSDSKESKPFKVKRHKLSLPPTTAASHRPAMMSLRADANAFADDVHAVDIV